MNWGLISVVLAVIFFITTVVLSTKLRRRKKLSWASQTTKVIGLGTDAPSELELLFNKRSVTDVYQTFFILFNSGNETIRHNDVTEVITVNIKDAEILRSPVIRATSREQIKFTATESSKTQNGAIKLDFLYLDHNDGALIEILHTGSEKITCSGNIVGIERISSIEDYSPYRRRFKKIWTLREFLTPIFGMAVIGFVLLMGAVLGDKTIGLLWDELDIIFYVFLGMPLGTFMGGLMIYLFPLTSPFPKWGFIKKP